MRIVALGELDEARGFALAGVETMSCLTPREAEARLSALGSDPTVGLVLVSASVDEMAPGAVARIRSQRRAPVILVLPRPGFEGANPP